MGMGNRKNQITVIRAVRGSLKRKLGDKPFAEAGAEYNHERLFEGNRLLLTSTIDHLFDCGFISFENDGELLVSPVAHDESMKKMSINTDRIVNVGSFANRNENSLNSIVKRVFEKLG